MAQENLDFTAVYVIFPCKHHELCDVLAIRICRKFQIKCFSIKYYYLTKEHAEKITDLLKQGCILIIGYEGKMTYENYYKMGIANAYKRQTILIDLEASRRYFDVPEYINYHFYIKRKDKSAEFLDRLDLVIAKIISNDIKAMLYKKILHRCELIEEGIGRSISKVNEDVFIERLKAQFKSDGMNFDDNTIHVLYLNDERRTLFELIVFISENETEAFEALSFYASNLTLEDMNETDQASQQTYVAGDLNVYQYGAGDNVAGDNVAGNKSVSNDEAKNAE